MHEPKPAAARHHRIKEPRVAKPAPPILYILEDTPDRKAHREMHRDSQLQQVDTMMPDQARTWFEQAMASPNGQRRLLRYLFTKLHPNIK